MTKLQSFSFCLRSLHCHSSDYLQSANYVLSDCKGTIFSTKSDEGRLLFFVLLIEYKELANLFLFLNGKTGF